MGSQVGEAYKGRLQQGSEAVPWFQRGTRGCFVVYRMREAFRSVLARWRQLSLATRSPSTPQPRSLQDEVGQPRQRVRLCYHTRHCATPQTHDSDDSDEAQGV